MDSLQRVLESAGLPAERGTFTGKKKPLAYYTFLRLLKGAAVSADDKEVAGKCIGLRFFTREILRRS